VGLWGGADWAGEGGEVYAEVAFPGWVEAQQLADRDNFVALLLCGMDDGLGEL